MSTTPFQERFWVNVCCMELNASLQGNCNPLDEEWMPFSEELDILREEFIALTNFIFVICMTFDKEKKNENHLLEI